MQNLLKFHPSVYWFDYSEIYNTSRDIEPNDVYSNLPLILLMYVKQEINKNAKKYELISRNLSAVFELSWRDNWLPLLEKNKAGWSIPLLLLKKIEALQISYGIG